MSHAHPVERAIARALGRVEVIVSVDVEHSDGICRNATQSGDHTEGNSAVPAQDEQCVTPCQQRGEALDQVLNGFGDLADVLRQRVSAIRAPDLERQVTLVLHLQTRCPEEKR